MYRDFTINESAMLIMPRSVNVLMTDVKDSRVYCEMHREDERTFETVVEHGNTILMVR